MKLDINLIWAIVVLLVAGMATVYSLNKQKLEKLKLIHPKLATVLETAGELALKATTYQASLDDKEGAKKLYDATDEVYNQLKTGKRIYGGQFVASTQRRPDEGQLLSEQEDCCHVTLRKDKD